MKFYCWLFQFYCWLCFTFLYLFICHAQLLILNCPWGINKDILSWTQFNWIELNQNLVFCSFTQKENKAEFFQNKKQCDKKKGGLATQLQRGHSQNKAVVCCDINAVPKIEIQSLSIPSWNSFVLQFYCSYPSEFVWSHPKL